MLKEYSEGDLNSRALEYDGQQSETEMCPVSDSKVVLQAAS